MEDEKYRDVRCDFNKKIGFLHTQRDFCVWFVNRIWFEWNELYWIIAFFRRFYQLFEWLRWLPAALIASTAANRRTTNVWVNSDLCLRYSQYRQLSPPTLILINRKRGSVMRWMLKSWWICKKSISLWKRKSATNWLITRRPPLTFNSGNECCVIDETW